MKLEATMDFPHRGLGIFKKGKIYDLPDTKEVLTLIKVGYFNEVKEEAPKEEPTEQVEKVEQIEEKEVKVDKRTKEYKQKNSTK